MIDAFKGAPPLNVIWGAGCSYGRPDAARTLVAELRINCKIPVKGPEEIHDALMGLSDEQRRERTSSYYLNWAHICLAELLRSGRVARVLTANFDQGIVRSLAESRLLPGWYDRRFPPLAESATPCIYWLGASEPGAVAGLIEGGAQTGPWVVLGCSGKHFGLSEALRAVPRFEHGLYWVKYFDELPPQALGSGYFTQERGAHLISGFDADSFMAYLLRGLGEFPPAWTLTDDGEARSCGGSEASPKPIDQLHRWCNRLSERAYKIRDSFPATARELLQRAGAARGPEYEELVEQALHEYELYFRWSPTSGYSASVFLGSLAEKRSPREAARLLRQGLEWIERYPASGADALEANQIAQAYAHLARFRTGRDADALFRKAEEAFAIVAPDRLGGFLLENCADVLCRWANQERSDDAHAIFERARAKFAEAQRVDPGKTDRLFRYAQALRQRAGAVSGERALKLLSAARGAVEELLKEKPKGVAGWHFLGLTAVLEAQNSPSREQDRLAEAERCFRQAISVHPASEGGILADWAAALGVFAMSRSGEEAFALYALADTKFRESEAIKPDSRPLHNNWSSALLREARERRGPAELWQRAIEHAERAETIDPGSGGYNLACIASERGDYEGVRRWLTRSAEYGKMMTLSHLLRDVNFQSLHNEAWFRELIAEIFDLA
jgi:hypothetical protein